MFNLKTLVNGYHKSAHSYAELIPWMAMWDEATIVNTDASLLAVYSYNGFEGEGKSRPEIDSIYHRYERAFGAFDSEMVLWNIIDRRRLQPEPRVEMDDPIANGIDQVYFESFHDGTCYRNHYSMAVQARPSRGTSAVFDTVDALMKEEDMAFGRALRKALAMQYSPSKRREFNRSATESLYYRLQTRLGEIEDSLPFLGLRRLKNEEMLSYLHSRANPATPGQRIAMPRVPVYLNTGLTSDHLRRQPGYLVFENGQRKYACLVTVKGWPDFTTPGGIDSIIGIDGEVTISHCFRFLDREVAEHIIRDAERHHINMSVPLMARLAAAMAKTEPTRFDSGRLKLAQDAQDALSRLTGDGMAFGYHNITIVCYGDTREEMFDVRTQVLRALKSAGHVGVSEGMHALSSFAGTLPGQWSASVRWELVSAANAADLAPIDTVQEGSPVSSFLTEKRDQKTPTMTCFRTVYGTRHFYDPFETGVGHGLVIGPTGGGKTTLVNFLLAQWRRNEPCRSYVLDKRYSCEIATGMLGGQHIDLSPGAESRATLNPLSLITDRRHWEFLARWIGDRLSSRGYQVTAEDSKTIYSAIENLSAVDNRAMHRLSGLAQFLGPSLKIHLEEWLQGREKGAYFDNEEDALDLSNHVCFELGDIFSDDSLAEAVCDYLFYRIEQQLTDGKPTFIYLEEIWFFLRNKKMAERYDDWLRTMRKLLTAVWAATQMSAEIMNADYFVTMADNIPNKVFLPNAAVGASAALYQNGFGLNDEQLARIQQGEPGRNYYFVTPAGSVMADLRLPPEVIAPLRSDTQARKAFHRHQRSGDPEWRLKYLQEILGRE